MLKVKSEMLEERMAEVEKLQSHVGSLNERLAQRPVDGSIAEMKSLKEELVKVENTLEETLTQKVKAEVCCLRVTW